VFLGDLLLVEGVGAGQMPNEQQLVRKYNHRQQIDEMYNQ
jgi:hypothetical protein